jgi:protein-L-isoaspartate(D-aspartate) O-methyltransferase
MTTDFARARLNMVNAQLATNGIHSEAMIEAYKALPREKLVDEALRPYVYMDEDLPAGPAKAWLLEPMVEAKMVQEAIRDNAGNALVLGAVNLPAAAMLAQFAKSVTVVEPDAKLAAAAPDRLRKAEIPNVHVVEADYLNGCEKNAPYDAIFVPGAVAQLSDVLTGQLSHGGVLVCVLRETPRAQGRIVAVRRKPEGGLELSTVADAATPYLPGFEPAAEFVF